MFLLVEKGVPGNLYRKFEVIVSFIHDSRGQDIYAACGLLSTKELLG